MDVQKLKTLRIIPLHQIIYCGPKLEDVVMGGDEYIQLVDFPVRITFPPISKNSCFQALIQLPMIMIVHTRIAAHLNKMLLDRLSVRV